MKNPIALIVLVSILFINSVFSQNHISVQVNGGMIIPANSFRGLTGYMQFNQPISDKSSLFFRTGYAVWDHNRVYFRDEDGNYKQLNTQSNHSMYSAFLGYKFNYMVSSPFTMYIEFQSGYSNLSFNKYNIREFISPEDGKKYLAHSGSEQITLNVFNFGAGSGIINNISENIDLILGLSVNTSISTGIEEHWIQKVSLL